MGQRLQLEKTTPYPLGCEYLPDKIRFAMENKTDEKCGIMLFPLAKDGTYEDAIRIPFQKKHRYGNVYAGALEGILPEAYSYCFYKGKTPITDPYSRCIRGHELWGVKPIKEYFTSGIVWESYNWEEDTPPEIPYEDSILYCLHTRGFTKHSSSKVKSKGTFQGIVEKIPYLKELGITGIELLPSYEFVELQTKESVLTMEEAVANYKNPLEADSGLSKTKINYWGFQEGFYFAPKASYSEGGKCPVQSFKDLVKELHQNNIELIMQFYFPNHFRPGFILAVIAYWKREYHIDGAHLIGDNIPITLLATEPALAHTKLLYNDFPLTEIYEEKELPLFRNLACYKDEFMYNMRRFLKGDEDMLNSFLRLIKENPVKTGIIHYITKYEGFTLMDLVSYDKKHNEGNGEENRDGNDYNVSWNCGIEGKSRKKSISDLRMRQMKNAMVFLLISQGTPMILAGDEFCNTQAGNNNPYCQDNEISWLRWNESKSNEELLHFTKELIALRKAHPILHMKQELKMMDYTSCGYPDLSIHGEEAWKTTLENYNRHIGIMLCGKCENKFSHSLICMPPKAANGSKYAKKEDKKEDAFFYIAFNMHWDSHVFALPRLPQDKSWKLLINTGKEDLSKVIENDKRQKQKKIAENKVDVAPRSIQIYMGI